MNQSQVFSFLQGLGIPSYRIRVQKNGWVQAPCPLARWKHERSRDDHPSFAVMIAANDRSWCKCQACGFSGNPHALISLLERYGVNISTQVEGLVNVFNQPDKSRIIERLRKSVEKLAQENPLRAQESTISLTKELGGIQVPKGVNWGDYDNQAPPFPDSAIHHLQEIPPEVMAYLTGPERNLNRTSIMDWELGFHAPTGMITMPIRDCRGRLISVSGRACLDPNQPKYRHTSTKDGFYKSLYLYGEHRVVKGRRGYLLEGNFDPIFLTQCGYGNAVAIMGTSMSPIQAEKICQFFSELYIAMDPDRAGKECAEKIQGALSYRLPVKLISLPGVDVDQLSYQQVRAVFGNPYS